MRGDDIFIVVDPGNYSVTYKLFDNVNHMSPDDHFANLKRLIQAVAGKAHRVSVIMPSLYGGRQHRRVVRESLDCAVALQELQTMGVQNIITFDAHDPRVQNAVPLMSFDNAMPTYQVLKSLLKKDPEISFDKSKFTVVSPDEGAMNRNMYFSSVLGCNLGMFYKRRDYTRVVNGRNPIVAHEYLGESVEGKTVFIADDIIASGESMLEVASNLKERGAARIIANATFPLFTSGLAKFDQAVAEGKLTYVVGTNLTYRTPELLTRDWYVDVDVSKYAAYFVVALNHDMSVSSIIDPLKKIELCWQSAHKPAEVCTRKAAVSNDTAAFLMRPRGLHFILAQIAQHGGQLVGQHQYPAEGVAVGQGFDLHPPQQHQHGRGGHTACHVQDAADQCDPQVADAAEEALDAVGGGGHQVEQRDRAQEPHAQVHHLRVGDEQPDDGLCKDQTDRHQAQCIHHLDAHAAAVAILHAVFLPGTFVLGHESGHGVGDVLLRSVGKVVDARCRGKGGHGADAHGVHDGLHRDLAQLHGGLLHGADPAVAYSLAQQLAVKHEPASAQLQHRNFPADVQGAEQAAHALAQHGGKGAALAAPAQASTKNRSPPMFSTALIIRKYRALLLSPRARSVAARKL
mgnify:CR=1 FL=1